MAQMPEAIILRKTEETKTGVTYCMADVKTNADRIRAMTDEEMASILTDDFCELICHSPVSCDGNCEIKMLEWLKKESAP